MSYITLSCILSVKIDLSFGSDTKYHENQDKKGLHLFLGRENGRNGEIQDGRQHI